MAGLSAEVGRKTSSNKIGEKGEEKKMRKSIVMLAALVLVCMAVMPVFAKKPETGNGAPSGPHVNINIIGVPKEKSMPEGLGGNVIFVALGKNEAITTRINLEMGDDVAVLDKDGTDRDATLQLPDPYPDDVSPGINTGEDAVYKIYVRALGKPGGSATITSGFTDEFGGEWLSLESVEVTRTKSQSKFSDQTLKLTTILVDMDGDGTPERYNLFGNPLWEYFWDYDNNGLKLLQLRIYMCP
jgi:hypothetical protein